MGALQLQNNETMTRWMLMTPKYGPATADDGSGNRHACAPRSTCVSRFHSLLNFVLTPPKKTSLPPYERTLFAALAPSPQTSSVLKSACRTWADHLWAQISIVCEEKESMELARLVAFWDCGVEKEREGGGGGEVEEEGTGEEEREWEKEVVGTLESLKGVQVADG